MLMTGNGRWVSEKPRISPTGTPLTWNTSIPRFSTALRQLRKAARELGFAHARGTDHKDVFRHYILGHIRIELLPPDAVAQRDCNRALGVRLADYILIEFPNDFARRQLLAGRLAR